MLGSKKKFFAITHQHTSLFELYKVPQIVALWLVYA